jgi:translation initiation factor 1A
MGKNTTGGKGQKRGKNSNSDKNRKVIYADNDSTLYGLVIKSLGDCRFSIHCSDFKERIGLVRGKMYKKTYINPEDLVLVSLRDFETLKEGEMERCDIIIKYNLEEVDQIRQSKQLYYKNTKKPFSTNTDHGKISSSELENGYTFESNGNENTEELNYLEENSKDSYDSDSEQDEIFIPNNKNTTTQIKKQSNVQIIDNNEKDTDFDFDSI